ncbi:MAG: fatty acid desaturase family protein [Pseudomonadota bacterium]
MGLLLLVHCWGIIAGAIALAIWQPLLIPLAIPIIGARQLGMAIIMHDGAHGAISPNRSLNDFAGQWLGAAPIGAHLKAYRRYHLQHHKYAQQPEDPDMMLSAPFPVTRTSLKRKIIRDLTGQTFFKQRLNQFSNAMGLGIRNENGVENRVQSAREAVVPFVAINLLFLALLTGLGHWWAYFVLWLLPMATWNQMITRLRNIAEHAVVPDNEDPLRHARTTHTKWWESLLIAPYWVNYHCEHHMFMHLPCYRLSAAHRLLTQKGITEHMEVQDSYLSVLAAASSKPEPTPTPA